MEKKPEKTDIFDAIAIQRGMLELSAAWPVRKKNPLYRLKETVIWTTICFFSVTLFLELYLNIIQQDWKHMTELLSFMASEISYIFKHIMFAWAARVFMDTIEYLERPIFKNYPLECDHHVRSSNTFVKAITRFYQFLVANLVIIYFAKPFFTKDNLAIRFAMFDLGAWRIPFHVFQVWAIGWSCWNNSTMDVLALGLISMGSVQFQILSDKLKNIRKWAGISYEQIDNGQFNDSSEINDVTDEKVQEMIKECVLHHMAIIQYASQLETIYSVYFLIQFIDSVLAICNTWFQFLMADDILNILFLVFYSATLMSQLGIYCFYGNNLMLKSMDIRDSCYLAEWYNCGISVRKSLMIIMERAKRPTVLTAGKFSILSLASYGTLMQSSYSYFALMNRLYGK